MKKMSKRQQNRGVFLLLLLVLCLMISAGCNETPAMQENKGDPGNNQPDKKEVDITDSLGESITLPYPLERVVVLNSNAAEAIRILEAQEAIIGIADSLLDEVYLGLDDRELVGKYNRPSYEKILELRPQAVFAYEKSYSDEDFSAKLEPLGIKVVKLNLYKPESYDDELRMLAKAFGKEQRAEDFIAWKKQKTDLLAGRIEDLGSRDPVSVLAIYTSDFAKGNYKTFAQNTSTHQGIELAGGKNIAGDMEGYPQVNGEWILEQNPQIFVLNTSGKVEMGYDVSDPTWSKDVVARAQKDALISKTDAGKNAQIYLLYNKLLSGDKTYIGAFYLAKWFYPDCFRDIDPELILQEYFEEWIGVPLQGIWSYKE